MLLTRSRIVVSLVAVALFACSSAPPDTTLDGELNSGNSAKSSKTPSKTSGTGTNTGTAQQTNPTDPADPAAPANPAAPATPTTPAPAGNGQCAGQQTADACFQCCDTASPGGFDVDSQAFGQCVCETPGTCAAACATSFCAGGPPTAACEQCLNGATQCEAQAEAACNANAACAAAFACSDSSGCNAKP